MKRVIKSSSELSLRDETVDPHQLPEGYREDLGGGYYAKKTNGQLSVDASRPYDDAEYYWALYDNSCNGWKIIFKGQVKNVLYYDDYEIDDIVSELDMLNSSISPRILHN